MASPSRLIVPTRDAYSVQDIHIQLHSTHQDIQSSYIYYMCIRKQYYLDLLSKTRW